MKRKILIGRYVSLFGALGVTALIAAGCGGSSDTTSSAYSPVTCAEMCDQLAALHCPSGPDPASCVADCDTSPMLSQCAAEADAWRGCFLARVQPKCDADGTLGTQTQITSAYSICQAELANLMNCGACIADSGDNECEACTKTQCCAERRAASGDAKAIGFLDCYESCADSACILKCDEKYPDVLAKVLALGECENSHCPGC